MLRYLCPGKVPSSLAQAFQVDPIDAHFDGSHRDLQVYLRARVCGAGRKFWGFWGLGFRVFG